MTTKQTKYTETAWTDGHGAPVNARNLNKIEAGITMAIDGVNNNAQEISKLKADEGSHYRQLRESIDNLKSDANDDKQLQEIVNLNVGASLDTLDKRIDAVYEASLGKIISGHSADINDSCVIVPKDALRTVGVTEIGVSDWHQYVSVPNMISDNATVGRIYGYGSMGIRDTTPQHLYMWLTIDGYYRGGGSITFNPITVGKYLYVQLDVVVSPYGGPQFRDFPTQILCSFTHGGTQYSLINTHGNRFFGKLPVPDDLGGEVSTIYLYSNSFMYFNLRVGSKLEVCDHTLTIHQLSYNMLDIEKDVILNGYYTTDGKEVSVIDRDISTWLEQTSTVRIPKLSAKSTNYYKLMFLGDVWIQGKVGVDHKFNQSNQAIGVEFSPHTVVDFKASTKDGSYSQPRKLDMMLVPGPVYPTSYIPYFKEPLITIDFEELGIVDFQIPGNYISFEDMCYHHKYTWDELSNAVPIEEEIIYIGDKLYTSGLVQVKENAQLYFTNGQDEPLMCSGKYSYLTKI